MAGIGFEMRKLLDRQTLAHSAQAYLFAGFLSSGPWIISIASIAILNLLMQDVLGLDDRTLFSTTVTYAYALALIVTGPLQLILTRHAADDLSAGNPGRLLPTCLGSMAMAGGISLLTGTLLFGSTDGPAVYKIGAVALHTNVSLIFVSTAFLGALRKYQEVVGSFVAGFLASGAAALLAVSEWGVAGAVVAFSLGQAFLLGLLVVLLGRELAGCESLASWDFLKTFRRFPSLAVCGFFYNFGIWIDKILFWWMSENTLQIGGILRAAPAYDVAIYLSLLSIVPGFAVFFLVLETGFARAFHDFFRITNGGATLDRIGKARQRMLQALRDGFSQLFFVQGLFTLSLLAFADPIGKLLGIGAVQLGIFRVTLLGAFLLIVFLSLLTVLFYLDDRRGAMSAAIVFGLGNALLSLATLLANEAWYGFGFVVAAAAGTLHAVIRVNRRMERFEQSVFLPEPVT